jgi:hypothetical protein
MSERKNIPMMLYDEKENGNVLFFFADLPIMKLLSQTPKSYKIKDLYLMASDYKMQYIFSDDIKNKKSIQNLLHFFTTNTQYSIDDMDAVLQNNIKISIHDDNEISFLFPKEYRYGRFINRLLNSLNYNSINVRSTLLKNRNKYLLIKRPDKLIKKYANFDDYWADNE